MEAKSPMNIRGITCSTTEWERGSFYSLSGKSGTPSQHPAQATVLDTSSREMIVEPESWKATASWLLLCQPTSSWANQLLGWASCQSPLILKLPCAQPLPYQAAMESSVMASCSHCLGQMATSYMVGRWTEGQKDGSPNKTETFHGLS